MSSLPPGLAPRLVSFCEELRSEGVAIGTSELLDAFAALDTVPWGREDDFREALAATIAKSQEDRRIFELLFDRFFFRAAESEALERGIGEDRRYDGGDGPDLREPPQAGRQALAGGRGGGVRGPAPPAVRPLRGGGGGS